jgi:hypothetical protein
MILNKIHRGKGSSECISEMCDQGSGINSKINHYCELRFVLQHPGGGQGKQNRPLVESKKNVGVRYGNHTADVMIYVQQVKMVLRVH